MGVGVECKCISLGESTRPLCQRMLEEVSAG